METPAKGLARGTLFAGRYEIIEELGAGGMGSVFRVEDTKIRQEVALKLIRPEIASSRRTIERFRNELKTARMIAHRNVCEGRGEQQHDLRSANDAEALLRPLFPSSRSNVNFGLCFSVLIRPSETRLLSGLWGGAVHYVLLPHPGILPVMPCQEA